MSVSDRSALARNNTMVLRLTKGTTTVLRPTEGTRRALRLAERSTMTLQLIKGNSKRVVQSALHDGRDHLVWIGIVEESCDSRLITFLGIRIPVQWLYSWWEGAEVILPIARVALYQY